MATTVAIFFMRYLLRQKKSLVLSMAATVTGYVLCEAHAEADKTAEH
jgi:hypothetical protein